MKRVVWDELEIRNLAEKMVGAIIAHPGEPLAKLLNGLQHMFAPERRRKLQSLKQAPELLRLIKEKLQTLQEKATTTIEPERILIETPPEEIIALMPLEQLLPMVAKRVSDDFSNLNQAMRLLRDTFRPAKEETYAQPMARPKRVAVVGFMAVQFQELERTIGEQARLVWVDRDLSKPAFPEADYVLLVTKFIRHHWDWVANQQFPSDKVIRINGGVSSAVLAIRKVLS